MASYEGWLKLWRKSRRSAVLDDANLWRLWCVLLMDANWEARQLLNGQKLEPGQLVVSTRLLAKEFRCGKSTIHRWLSRLEALGNIGTQSGTLGTVVTICNWGTYQQDDSKSGTPNGTRAGHERDSSGTRAGQEEEVKKGRREEKLGARFIKPTFQEVTDYCAERKNSIDPQAFLDHYEANGWVQGRGKPIKSWKACVRTWENQRKGEAEPEVQRLPTAEEDKLWTPSQGIPGRMGQLKR